MLLATAATESNFQNTFKSFGIEASPIAFDILSSKLYSNTTLAIVRELLSNAYDAMAEAGTLGTRKMNVHFPDMMESRFIVRDYGNGLNEEEIFNLYTTFFKSTKRDSNEFTGCYGLGSKSPFAYGDSFMVESYQNGTAKKYLMAKMNGYPKVTKLDEKQTEEENGMKITIPVPEGDKDFYYEFCKYVKYQPDLAKAIESNAEFNYAEFCKEYDEGFCKVSLATETTPYRNTDIFIKQGMNIFPAKMDASTFGFTVIAEVPIGTFEIVPSREALSESESNQKKFKRVKNSIVDVMSKVLSEFNPHSSYVYDSYLHEPIAESLRKKYFFCKSMVSGYSYYRDNSSLSVQKCYNDRTNKKIVYTGYIAGLTEIKSYVKDPFSINESSVRDDIPMIIVVGKEYDSDWGKVKRKMSTYSDFKEMNIYVKGFKYDYWKNNPTCFEYPICKKSITNDIPCVGGISPKDAIEYLKNIVWTYNSIPELNFDIQIMPIHTFLRKFKTTRQPSAKKTHSAPVNTQVGVLEITSYGQPVPNYFKDSPLKDHLARWNILGVALKKDLPEESVMQGITFLANRKIRNGHGKIAIKEAFMNQNILMNDNKDKHHILFLSSRGYQQAMEMGLKPIDMQKLIDDLKSMSISFYIKSNLIEFGELKFIDTLFTEDKDVRHMRDIKLPLHVIKRIKETRFYKMHKAYMALAEKVTSNLLEFSHQVSIVERFFRFCPTVRIHEYGNTMMLPRLAMFYNYLSKRPKSYAFPSKESQYRIADFILNNKNHL